MRAHCTCSLASVGGGGGGGDQVSARSEKRALAPAIVCPGAISPACHLIDYLSPPRLPLARPPADAQLFQQQRRRRPQVAVNKRRREPINNSLKLAPAKWALVSAAGLLWAASLCHFFKTPRCRGARKTRSSLLAPRTSATPDSRAAGERARAGHQVASKLSINHLDRSSAGQGGRGAI